MGPPRAPPATPPPLPRPGAGAAPGVWPREARPRAGRPLPRKPATRRGATRFTVEMPEGAPRRMWPATGGAAPQQPRPP
eukprot:14686794-Alexandrium_andersonii.AAC.1